MNENNIKLNKAKEFLFRVMEREIHGIRDYDLEYFFKSVEVIAKIVEVLSKFPIEDDEALKAKVSARTNFDEVTESPEALAEAMSMHCLLCVYKNTACNGDMCKDGFLQQLNQPAEESGVNENDEV
jgi:hypothetical protein